MNSIIDGKSLSEQLLNELKSGIIKKGIIPGLAVILVGNNEASAIYVRKKVEAAKRVDINAHLVSLPAESSKDQIIAAVKEYNANPDFHGIIVQLPLPDYDMADEVIAAIDPEKDADGFHPETLKKLREGKRETLPVMSRVILYILDHEKYNLRGRKVLIAAHNPYFIEGQKILLEERGGTVSSCEPTDPRLGDFTRQADVLIAAGRSPALITQDMVKDQALVIDIGIHKDSAGKTVGCIDFKQVAPKCLAITPVPNGVGPLTVAFLLKNVYEAALRSSQ